LQSRFLQPKAEQFAGILRKCDSDQLINVMLLAATAASRPSSRDCCCCAEWPMRCNGRGHSSLYIYNFFGWNAVLMPLISASQI